MSARKYSASMTSDLLDEVERAAAGAGQTVSAFMADAARARIALLALDRLVADWEMEHGALTDDEMLIAEQQLEASLTPKQVLRKPRPVRRSA